MTGKEVLRALADGADLSDFEMLYQRGWGAASRARLSMAKDDRIEFRRKPRTRVVNGFTVPAPIQEMPKDGYMYFLAVADASNWFATYKWDGSSGDNLWFSRGLLFSTKEAAIANAKAMVGIDPEAE